MATYCYRCPKCDHRFEKTRSIHDPDYFAGEPCLVCKVQGVTSTVVRDFPAERKSIQPVMVTRVGKDRLRRAIDGDHAPGEDIVATT